MYGQSKSCWLCMRDCLYLQLSIWSTSILSSLSQRFKGPEKEIMSSEPAGNFSFFLSLWSGEVIGKGRCVPLVCRFISFFTDTSQVLWRWTSPLFSFLLHNVIWGYFIPQYIWAFLFLPALPEFSLWSYLWFSFFDFRKLKGTHCIYQSGCSWWYCIRELLPNWTSGLQQQNLFFSLDFVEVSRNLLSVQSNATHDGHKSSTFGVSEFGSLQDSQVKYVPGQCFNSWEEMEILLYVKNSKSCAV